MIKHWLKTSLVLHTRQLKEDNEKKLKQNPERYEVREGSPVEVRWVGEDLWWEGFVEQVSLLTIHNSIHILNT